MSGNEITRFVAAAKADTALQEEIKKCSGGTAALAQLAKSKGFDFTSGELDSYIESMKGELSDEQLAKVAGGGSTDYVYVVNVVVAV